MFVPKNIKNYVLFSITNFPSKENDRFFNNFVTQIVIE